MFQQHHGESLSEAWTHFKDLLQKFPHHGIDLWLQIQIFYDYVSFHLKCEINRAAGGKLQNKNSDESWEIIENFALYNHEGWNDMKEFVKPIKSSTHIPHAYADAVHFNPGLQNHNEQSKLNPFTFHERTGLSPQPQALGTTFEARTSQGTHDQHSPEKVLIREEDKFPVTKNVNSISLARGEEERSDKMDETLDNTEKPTITETEIPHRINQKLIKGLVNNNRFNDSLSRTRVGKVKGKTDNMLPRGPVYEAILKKKITKKEDFGGNFEIPYSIRGLKHVNVLVDQGSNVNVMPYSTYMKLTNEMSAETDIRLSLASYSYIYPLGIAEDVLVEAAIKFDKGTITLRSGKSKISFHRIPDSPCMTEKGVKNHIEPIAPTMTINRLVLKCEERTKLHLEREMKFNQWRSKNFKGKHPTLIATKGGMEDKRKVT
ncbi:hypothetical protein Tco_0454665 [Tanacetum coccineum]